jgi:hypothetical protein
LPGCMDASIKNQCSHLPVHHSNPRYRNEVDLVLVELVFS